VRCLRPHSDLKLANKSHNINLATTHTDDHWSLTVGFLVVQKIWLKCHGKRNLWTSVRYTITAVTTWNQLRSCSESRSKINRIRRVNRIPRDRSGGGHPIIRLHRGMTTGWSVETVYYSDALASPTMDGALWRGRWKCRTWHWRTSFFLVLLCWPGGEVMLSFAVSGRRPPAEFSYAESLE